MALLAAEIGDAIVAKILTLNPGMGVARRWVVPDKLGDVESMECSVIPNTDTQALASRKSDQRTIGFLLVFRKQMTPGTDEARTAEIDGHLETIESIVAGLNRVDMANTKWTGNVTREPIVEVSQLETHNLMIASVGIEYLKHVEVGS